MQIFAELVRVWTKLVQQSSVLCLYLPEFAWHETCLTLNYSELYRTYANSVEEGQILFIIKRTHYNLTKMLRFPTDKGEG